MQVAEIERLKLDLKSSLLQSVFTMASSPFELEYVTLDVFTNTKYEVRNGRSLFIVLAETRTCLDQAILIDDCRETLSLLSRFQDR